MEETLSRRAKVRLSAFFTAKNIAYFAILLALVIVLQIFASAIPFFGVQLNFSLVPIVLGALLFGPAGGALLGLACGIVVLVQVIMGLAPFYVVIWANSPVVTFLVCTLKTTVAGLAAGFVYRLLRHKNSLVAAFVAAAIVPVLNTGLFILGCLCMGDAISLFSGEIGYGGMNLFVFILVVLVSFNFFIEFAINLILAPAIHRVVLIVEKQIGKKRGPAAEESDSCEPRSESQNDTERL